MLCEYNICDLHASVTSFNYGKTCVWKFGFVVIIGDLF